MKATKMCYPVIKMIIMKIFDWITGKIHTSDEDYFGRVFYPDLTIQLLSFLIEQIRIRKSMQNALLVKLCSHHKSDFKTEFVCLCVFVCLIAAQTVEVLV